MLRDVSARGGGEKIRGVVGNWGVNYVNEKGRYLVLREGCFWQTPFSTLRSTGTREEGKVRGS